MKPLKSHPNKLLECHIREVQQAANSILSRHCCIPVEADVIEDIVSLHDVGKSTLWFQKYINTQRWQGDPMQKAHTPLGFVLSTALGRAAGRDLKWYLPVCFSVLGHHSGIPSREDINSKLQGDEWRDILERQFESFPTVSAAEAIGHSANLLDNLEIDFFKLYRHWYKLFVDVDKILEENIEEAIHLRLSTQFCFSVLLEADKVYLALSEDGKDRYLNSSKPDFQGNLVDSFIADQPYTPINELRSKVRKEALEIMDLNSESRLFTLTLPTGLGKTLTAASLAFTRWKRADEAKKIIIVLPYLSIIDQTSKVYGDLLVNPETSVLMQSHSLSDYKYDDTEEEDAEFFLDTWQSSIIITTFDQFLLALLSSKTRHQMRFHNMVDAIVIMDEVQAMPTHLWDIVDQAIRSMTKSFNTTVIAMSATQPGFIRDACELTRDKVNLYSQFNRYQLVLKHRTPMKLDEFSDMLLRERKKELSEKRLLVTLNTRRSARKVFDNLKDFWPHPVYFLSADVTPKDRLNVIEKLKKDKGPCLVVSTQVIEAGVDIDMDHVIRDFAPLDSIIQVAGRCNRNGKKTCSDVEVVYLVGKDGKSYASKVYKDVSGGPDLSLQETIGVLASHDVIPEHSILPFCEEYFKRLYEKKNIGATHTRQWAGFIEPLPVSQLLRGDSSRQHSLIIPERDEDKEELLQIVEETLSLEDHWERRRRLRKIAARLASITVNVWATRGFNPAYIADNIGPYWFVREGYYHEVRGLDLGINEPLLL